MFKLDAVKREQKSTKVRAEGKIPAVVYGAGLTTDSISLDLKEFKKVYEKAGEASLIDLTVDGKDAGKVLVYQVDYEPVKEKIIHVDLKKVDMSKPITATIKLIFIGEAPAVKELGGTLVRSIEELDIKCLPKDLINQLEIDLNVLKTFEDAVKISDLKFPAGVELVDAQAEQIIAKVAAPLTEEQLKAMEESSAPADLSQIESATKEKEPETEESKEGEEKK